MRRCASQLERGKKIVDGSILRLVPLAQDSGERSAKVSATLRGGLAKFCGERWRRVEALDNFASILVFFIDRMVRNDYSQHAVYLAGTLTHPVSYLVDVYKKQPHPLHVIEIQTAASARNIDIK